MRSRMIFGKTKPTSLLRSKNTFLADLPPGSSVGTRGKSVGGSVGGSQDPHAIQVQSKTELGKKEPAHRSVLSEFVYYTSSRMTISAASPRRGPFLMMRV